MSLPIQFSFPGAVTINIGLTAEQVQTLITAALEATMTTVDEHLAALSTAVANLSAAEASDRAAFDSLAAAVRAFLAALPPAGGTLTAEQAAQAQALIDSIGGVAASDTAEATDEASLQGEVPPVA